MTTFTDGLNGTSGDSLSARSGWSRPTGADDAQIDASGSGIRFTNGTTAASGTWHTPTSQPSGNDQYCTGLLPTGGIANAFPLGIRCNTASATGVGYLLRRGGSANVLELYRRSAAGALTSIGSYSGVSGDYVNPCTIRAVGNQISAEINSVTVIGPVTDSNISSGSVAALSRGGSLYTSPALDNWDSGDVAAGAYSIAADAGAFTLSGTAASLLFGRAIGASSGSFSLTGTDATLTYTPVGVYTLAANAGSFTLTGTSAGLIAARKIAADTASFALTGTAAGLFKGRTLTADAGAFALTGQSAGFLFSRVMAADAGAFVLTGSDATLRYSGQSLWTPVAAPSGVWTLVPPAAGVWS